MAILETDLRNAYTYTFHGTYNLTYIETYKHTCTYTNTIYICTYS